MVIAMSLTVDQTAAQIKGTAMVTMEVGEVDSISSEA
jgi:hypothetical protein